MGLGWWTTGNCPRGPASTAPEARLQPPQRPGFNGPGHPASTVPEAQLLLLTVDLDHPSCEGKEPLQKGWKILFLVAKHGSPHIHSHISLPSARLSPLPAQEPVSNRDTRMISSAQAFLSDIPAAPHRLSLPALQQ